MKTDVQLLMEKLMDFYSHPANMQKFLDVVVIKKIDIPLRVFDWFLTNYSKKYDVNYQIKKANGSVTNFKVWRRYQAELSAYKKKKWDPFCRGDHIVMEYEMPGSDQVIEFETALCQMNSFRFMIKYLVIDYVHAHYDEIYEDMKKNNSQSRQKLPKLGEGKKTELSKSIYRSMCVSNQNTTIKLSKRT